MAQLICNDLYNSSKKRKEYLVLTCGQPSMNTVTPSAKGEDENSCSDDDDDDSSGDEENQTVSCNSSSFDDSTTNRFTLHFVD